MIPRSVFNALFRGRTRRFAGLRALPDRRLMAEAYIPALAGAGGRILWVGCRAYTAEDYPALERCGAEVWTTDVDPEAARWGRRDRHRTGDLCGIDRVFPDLMFDAIVCNGVFGFGVDTETPQREAFRAMGRILRPGGVLVLGWNTDRTADPLSAGLEQPEFRPAPFAGQPKRVVFETVTHVYDTLVRAQD